MTNTISLITAIISFVVAIIGLIKSKKNRQQADKEINNSIRRSLESQKNQLIINRLILNTIINSLPDSSSPSIKILINDLNFITDINKLYYSNLDK